MNFHKVGIVTILFCINEIDAEMTVPRWMSEVEVIGKGKIKYTYIMGTNRHSFKFQL